MIPYARNLQYRLALYVGLVLLAFTALASGLVYTLAYEDELDAAASLEQQLVNTVRAQAEVAAYAANLRIAEGVIDGLRENPRIRAVRIVGEPGRPFSASGGLATGHDAAAATDYPLYSPVDGKDRVGTLTVIRNHAVIHTEARLTALRQALIMILQIIATTVLIMLFTRQLVSAPVERLDQALAAIKPGSGARVDVGRRHTYDEIGSLAGSINNLIATAENALAEVREMATTDVLTGLMNRRAFMTHLENELARIKRYELPPACLLMLDLDHFKHINDQYGHAAGDAVLQAFGALLSEELRKVDSAGRIGGEEFAIVLPATEMGAATVFAERLRGRIADLAISQAEATLHVTVSIGIAQLLSDDLRPDAGLARADRALYRAKENGRNRIELDATRIGHAGA